MALVGCTTTSQITQEEEKVVLTNIINRVNLVGEGIFNNSMNNVSITVKPIDAREFDRLIASSKYFGGEHLSVFASINKVKSKDLESSQNEYEMLTNKLLDEGLTFDDVLSIIEIVDEQLEASEEVYVYTDPNIQLKSKYGVSEYNPFGSDGRYLTVVELEIDNRSSEAQRVCEDEFIITSNTTSYTNISTNELLNDFSAGSLRYELLHKTLMKSCEIIPSNSSIITHLVFPSFYDQEDLTIHYRIGDSLTADNFRIENYVTTNQYYFSKINIEGDKYRGYRILGESTPSITRNYPSMGVDDFHFVRIGNSVDYIGFGDFLIHDDIDFQSVEILTVRYKDKESIEIVKTPITRQDIVNGSIRIVAE